MASNAVNMSTYKSRILAHTPSNTGVFLRGDNIFTNVLTASPTVRVNGEGAVMVADGAHYTDNTFRVILDLNPSSGNHGIWSSGYLNGTTFTSSGLWLLVRDKTGAVQMNGNAASATKLSNTPNNTTTFLRGDNTWTNKLTGKFLFSEDGSLALYTVDGGNNCGTETVAIQTCFDSVDASTHSYVTQYESRCNLLLQPRGGQVYVGKNHQALGNTDYSLLVYGGLYAENLHLDTGVANRFATFDTNGKLRAGNGNCGNDHSCLMPSHYYHEMYSSNAATGTEVYVHYYNLSTTSTYTYANLRVKNGNNIRLLRFGGDGTFQWSGYNVARASTSGVGGSTTPVYINSSGVITAGTALGASAYHADSYFALSGHNHDAVYVNVSGDTMNGRLSICNAAGPGTSPGQATLELREVQRLVDNSSLAHNATNAPRLGFHWGNRYWGQLAFFDSAFRFYNSDLSGYYPVYASRFYGALTGDVTGNCSGNAATATALGSNAGSASKAIYFSGGKPVQCNYALGHTADGIHSTDPQLAATSESNEIRIHTYGTDQGQGVGWGITHAICFRWYNTLWSIGSIRGGSTDSVGFGFLYSDNSYGNKSIKARITPDGYFYASRVYNSVWNDYAEYRLSEAREPGYAIGPSGRCTTSRLEPGVRIISDTYGHAIGQLEGRDDMQPVALSGRVLAYPYQDISQYHVGDAVCSAPGGKVDIMTREEIKEYPDRIIGIVNEIPDYDIWEPSKNTEKIIQVNGRIWIDIK